MILCYGGQFQTHKNVHIVYEEKKQQQLKLPFSVSTESLSQSLMWRLYQNRFDCLIKFPS